MNETYYSKHDYAPVFMKCANQIIKDFDVFRTVTEITRNAPIRMNQKLSAIFISKVGEMFNNALEHSDGTVLGAKYFKFQKNTYCFSCCDTGVGIPNKVMASNEDITDSVEAFKWAMKDGNSTAFGGVPRGLGLGLLKNFAKANAGTIRICSGNVLYIYNQNQIEKYQRLKYAFQGTLFEMDIIADNDHEYIIR